MSNKTTTNMHSLRAAQSQLKIENANLKLNLERLAEVISKIATRIDIENLPENITLRFIISNWKRVKNLLNDIINIIKTIRDNRPSDQLLEKPTVKVNI